MAGKILKNKPLIEAIFEVRWALTSPAPGVEVDPHYKILVGRLYDRVSTDYPEHEQLPAAAVPDELVGHVVQHRFRYAQDDWPLIQVGPGILTVNDTHKYTWDDFRSRGITAVERLFDAHPNREDLRVESLLLRYIDVVEFDYVKEDVFAFLNEKMKVSISLPESLFSGADVQRIPVSFNWQSSFGCENPKGIVTVRFATGQKDGKPVLLWETLVQSAHPHVPTLPQEFEHWIEAAHRITDDWFFKLIDGELERRFSGE